MNLKKFLTIVTLGTCGILLGLEPSLSQGVNMASGTEVVAHNGNIEKNQKIQTTQRNRKNDVHQPKSKSYDFSSESSISSDSSHKGPYLVALPSTPAIPIDPLSAIEKGDILPKHRAISREVLSILPPSCQQKLRQYYVLYDQPKHRGLAGDGVIIMNGTLSDAEFKELLSHEGLGHFWDISCLKGTSTSGASAFRDGNTPLWNNDPSVSFYSLSWQNSSTKKSDAKSEDFVTAYAKTDPFEDLAESVSMYMTDKTGFEKKAEKSNALRMKLLWIEKNFPGA
jgi:hypothetical protein